MKHKLGDFPMQTEADIWRDFKAGDEKAYEWLYRQYFFLLFRYGKKIVSDKELIKDCIQDLFVELWRTRQKLGEPQSVKAYLLVSLRRSILRKADGQFQELSDVHNLETVESHEWQLVENQTLVEKNQQLARAIETLTKRQREAIFLKFHSNLSYDEIAQVMAITKDSVYVLISKALDLLQKNMLPLLPFLFLFV